MNLDQQNHGHPAGEALSAFFVGLLYFLVQWVWQMQNSKNGAGLPFAYALILACTVSGAFSWHSLLMYSVYPSMRMRVMNFLLFLPFGVVTVSSYARTREVALVAEPALKGQWWFLGLGPMVALGLFIAAVPLGASIFVAKREAASSSRPRSRET